MYDVRRTSSLVIGKVTFGAAAAVLFLFIWSPVLLVLAGLTFGLFTGDFWLGDNLIDAISSDGPSKSVDDDVVCWEEQGRGGSSIEACAPAP